MADFEMDQLDGIYPERGYDEEYDISPNEAETEFDGEHPEWTSNELPDTVDNEIQAINNQKAKELFYESIIALGWEVDLDAALNHGMIFEEDPRTKHVYVKSTSFGGKAEKTQLTTRRNPKQFLSLSTIAANTNVSFVRDVLGVENYTGRARPRLPSQVIDAATQGREDIPIVENIPLYDLSTTIIDVQEDLIKFTNEIGVNTNIDDQVLRDVGRYNQQLNTVRGQIEAASIKINEYDDMIEQERENSAADITEEEKERRTERIADLEAKIKFQKEKIIGPLIPQINNQFESIRQTYDKIIGGELTLGEKIRTLFREQGITITAIITAMGFVIDKIVSLIIAATRTTTSAIPPPKPKPPGPEPGPGPSPGPTPKPEPGIRGWIKQQLQKIANLLLKLGDKLLIALPGIIGSVVAFILKTASAAVGFVAENLWMLIVAIGGLIYTWINSESIKRKPR